MINSVKNMTVLYAFLSIGVAAMVWAFWSMKRDGLLARKTTAKPSVKQGSIVFMKDKVTHTKNIR